MTNTAGMSNCIMLWHCILNDINLLNKLYIISIWFESFFRGGNALAVLSVEVLLGQRRHLWMAS